MSKRRTPVYYFNNCHNFDHVGFYGAGAFFDLGTTGRQGNQARNLCPGQVCVVGSLSSENRVVFKWYSFERETPLPGAGGMLTRVFFGTFLVSEELKKSKAASSARYSALFKNTGDFKQGSVFQKDLPPNGWPVSARNVEASSTKTAKGGAGFGDPIENKLVESAAIREVVRAYEHDGWSVHSVERDKCGFDLECQKDRVIENVEVKGIRASEPCFNITAGEVEQARKNTKFVLVAVTSALSATPILTKYSGAEFCRQFDLSPIQYRAILRS
ncbi:MAG: DUF3883 domain-containing protein [Planctomycetia bacterium]|nr:DUF3883 domain-containing protein [Planctomycetia bacterium]